MVISNILQNWYELNKRSLPWRSTKEPYPIWVSEVILQQTRVIQGISYYKKFIAKYPDIQSLAKANEDDVLKLWQGLGYYSRARNMLTASKQITEYYNGCFPNTFNELLNIKGIGHYTAAAIASICFNQPHAVVDGNVIRVISRLFSIRLPMDSTPGIRKIKKITNEILDIKHPGNHNQAIMELGALICTPQNPSCKECPIKAFCKANHSNVVDKIPIKGKKLKIKKRFFHYLYINDSNYLFIKKRIKNDIWKNMYDLPLIELSKSDKNVILDKKKEWTDIFNDIKYRVTKIHKPIKHKLTHQEIVIVFYEIHTNIHWLKNNGLMKISYDELKNYALPKPIEVFLQKYATKHQ